MINTSILAVDSYLPNKIVTNDALSEVVDTSDEWISTRTGIKKRHISTGENTSELCINVGKRLLDKSNTHPDEIDLIIVATITPDYATPSTACIVQGALGCKNAFAFDLSAACSGFVFALSVADKYIKSGIYKKIIVIGAEVLSKAIDWTDRSTCVLFGDGAGGVLLEGSSNAGIICEDLNSNGNDGLSLTSNYMPVNNIFNKEDADQYLHMDGKAIFNFAVKVVPSTINNLLAKANLTIDDIDYIVPHQANSRIINFVARKLKTSIDKFYINIHDYGNTSAATIPIALSDMDKKGLLKKHSKIILVGFGGGLTWGSMLIQL